MKDMNTFPMTVLIFEPNSSAHPAYLRALEGSGYYIEFAQTEKEFIFGCNKFVPDVLVLNDVSKDVHTSSIVKRIRKDSIFKKCGIIMLVEKIGHTTSQKAKQLDVELELFPIVNHQFLQVVKKLGKSVTLPGVDFDDHIQVKVKTHIEYESINQLELNFTSPMKLTKDHEVQLSGKIIEDLNIQVDEFEVEKDGVMEKGKSFRNSVLLVGLSNETLKKLKLYEMGKFK